MTNPTKENPFRKAVKEESKLRLGLAGPSGSGKTWTLLKIATTLWEKVSLADTEHASAAKYADDFNFDHMIIEAPYTVQKYIDAIKSAEEFGYECLILDQISHAWAGSGGLLEQVDDLVINSKSRDATRQAWKKATPQYLKLIETILAANLHVLTAVRSKQEYVMVDGEDGKKKMQKVGMAPVQREGMDYEYDIFGNMDMDHTLHIDKSRCSVVSGKSFHKPGDDFADVLRAWLKGEKPRDLVAEGIAEIEEFLKSELFSDDERALFQTETRPKIRSIEAVNRVKIKAIERHTERLAARKAMQPTEEREPVKA